MRTFSLIIITVLLICNNAFAQFDGSFETGNTFTANGWTVANDNVNKWYLGAAGANGTGKGAYISSNGYSNVYSDATDQYSHIYTLVNFPAGYPDLKLSFNWRCQGMNGYHRLNVFLVPTSLAINAGTPIDVAYRIGSWSYSQYGVSPIEWQTEQIQLNANFEGTSQYLVFSWENVNEWGIYNPPASIDNVNLTYNFPVMHRQTVIVGDTVELRVNGATGLVQWQESTDSINWSDINGFTHSVERFITTPVAGNLKYYRARITDNDCLPHAPFYSSIIRHKIVDDYSQLQMGDWYQGGYVYNKDGSGGGQVASDIDQSSGIAWGCNNTDIPGAASFTDGLVNTTDIVSGCSDRPIPASMCADLNYQHYSDWFLPASSQLQELYNYKAIVGGFYDSYWSSTEYDATSVWMFNSIGESYTYPKSYTWVDVRCVRVFNSSSKIIYSTVFAPNLYYTVQFASQPLTQNRCIGDDVTFSVILSGTPLFEVQWYKDGNIINGATDIVYTILNAQPSDNGIYTCVAGNTCRSITSTPAELKVIEHSATFETDMRICRGSSIPINLVCVSNQPSVSGAFTYAWTPATGLSSAIINNPMANPVVSTSYSVLITDQIGCSTTFTVPVTVGIPFEEEEICLVTVDETTGRNKVTWEKTDGVGTQYYLIYKETGANDFTNVGNVLATQPGEFIDIFSQPQSYANRYKITCLDTCGNESQMSYSHKTINLTLSSTGSTMGLQWNDYVEESGTFVPLWFYIYRGSSPSAMSIIDSVSGGLGSYNDMNVFDIYYYKIGVKREDGCNGGKSVVWAFSNQKDNSSLVSAENLSFSTGTILISPNPMTDFTTLTIPNLQSSIRNPQSAINQSAIRITDVTGKVIRTEPLSSHLSGSSPDEPARIKILRGDLKSGIYFVELQADRIYRGKLVVE